MKVILLQDVKGTGKKDSVVEVNDGYARNFLFKKNLAIAGDAQNVNTLKHRLESEEKKKLEDKADAEKQKAILEGLSVTVTVKGSENGKMFGSVTSAEIASELFKLGVDVDKKKIVLKDNIRDFGEYSIQLKLYPEVSAQLKVIVVKA